MGNKLAQLPSENGGFPPSQEFQIKTKFSEFVRPLVDGLKALGRAGEKEGLESFRLIYDFIKDRDLSGMEFTKEDVMFLVTNPIGNLIRRPVIHTYFAQRVDNAVQPVDEKERIVKKIYVEALKAHAWSKFASDNKLLARINNPALKGGVFLS